MNKELILEAFKELANIAKEKNTVVDIMVYGGSALSLAYNFRESTKDIDAVYENSKDFISTASVIVAEKFNLPDDWINDAVKGYLSSKNKEEMIHLYDLPDPTNPSLRIFVPSPEYMLALKCIDLRVGHSKDVEDIKNLIKYCDIQTSKDVLDIIESFYPIKRIQQKTIYALEELFDKESKNNVFIHKEPKVPSETIEKIQEFRKNKENIIKNNIL